MILSPIRYLIILFVTSGVLFALDTSGAFSFVSSNTGRYIVGPVISTGNSFVKNGVSLFESIFLFRTFFEENQALEKERDHFRGEYFRLLAVEEENEFLRGALDLDEDSRTNLIPADITAFDPLRPNQFAVVNRGADDGVRQGSPVIVAGRILVGKVEEVFANTSRVLLLTSESSRVVTKLERSSTNAIISGSASGALIMDLVLPEIELHEGEIIVSSGLEGDIPPGLLVGQISKIISEETASFKKAVVRPFFSTRDLNQVFVVTFR